MSRMSNRNHYTSVVVDGNIIGWTGANPEKDANSKIHALQRAECYRSMGHTAYAVEIIEIKEEDVNHGKI